MLLPQLTGSEGFVLFCFVVRHVSYPEIPAGQDGFWTGRVVPLRDQVNRMFY